jgi:YD repeat-containing protein
MHWDVYSYGRAPSAQVSLWLIVKIATFAKPENLNNHFMKKFTILISFLIQAVLAIGQIANDDQSFFDYTYNKSIIKTNKIQTVTIEMSFPSGKSSSKSTYHFDKDGLLTKESIIDSGGKLLLEYYFLTNTHGDLIYRIENDYQYKRVDTVKYFKSYSDDKLIKDSSSQLPISYNYEYDLNGNIFKTVIVSNYGLGYYNKRVTINKFDSLNRISNSVETVFQNEIDTTGIIYSDRYYFYNKNGKIVKEVEKLNSNYSSMANKGSINYSYDQNGNLTEIVRNNAASYYYSYNDNGLITKKRMNMKLDKDDLLDKTIKVKTFAKFSYTFR